MTETELRERLMDALIRSGVDQGLIRSAYAIGSHFVADCVVLSSDGLTPAICFEIKAQVSASNLDRQYLMVSRVYRERIGIDVCYLVCPVEMDGDVVAVIKGKENLIRLDSDPRAIRLFIGKDKNEVAIALENQSNDLSVRNLKSVAWKIAPFTLMLIGLDAFNVIPFEKEHWLITLGTMAMLLFPYLADVFIVHPKLLDQIIKLLDKAYKKRGV